MHCNSKFSLKKFICLKNIIISFIIANSNFSFAQKEIPKTKAIFISEEIIIDGVNNEKVWDDAFESEKFWQYRPSDSLPAEKQTEFKFLYNEKSLFLFVKAYSKNKDYVVPSLERDFEGYGTDFFTFTFDTFSDATNGFFFGTNPLGVKRESLLSNGASDYRRDSNSSWDTKWEVETKIYEDYYTAEIKIPFSSLNFPENKKIWRFNLYRYNTQNSEFTTWAKVPRNQMIVNLAFMGEIEFEKPLGKSRTPFYLIPYLNAITSNDFEEKIKKNKAIIGGDAKISISNGLNLDLTFNPDFSQVEVDDEIINLTRFEVSLPEKRQFFVQNSDLFSNYGNSRDARPFFSRRIGVAKDINGNTIENKIIAGARLSGKIDENWRIGILNMLTEEDIKNEIPSNNNTVFAIQRKVFSRSNISLLMINRESMKSYSFLANTEKYNRLLGIDYNLASKNNEWTGRLYMHKSFTPNFGKDNLSSGVRVERNKTKSTISAGAGYVGSDFKSDLGYIRRTDIFKSRASYQYRIYPENEKIRYYGFRQGVYLTHKPDIDFFLSDRTYLTEFTMDFNNLSDLEIQTFSRMTYLFKPFDPTGSDSENPLPAGRSYKYTEIEFNYSSDLRKPFSFDIGTSLGQFYNGNIYSVESEFEFKFQPFVSTGLELSFDKVILPKPYPTSSLWLLNPWIDVTFSKNTSWNTLIQFNSQSETLGINTRFRWRFAPLSDLFIVYNDNYIAENPFIPRLRSLNLKLTYWLNLN